ncbi:hypothetical protein ScPMuIL_017192 [Solemya velum]
MITRKEIFLLSELKILDLSGNFFSEIAPEVAGLKKLKKFLMRRNALLRLPEEFFELKHLESLDLAHQLFLASEALHLLVFDLFCYKPEDYDMRIGDWVDAIVDRAPGASIMIVGTHADLCCECDIKEKTSHILETMHANEDAKMTDLRNEYKRLETELQKLQTEDSTKTFGDIDTERLQEKCLHLQRVLETRVVLPQDIIIVSCTEDLQGISDFRKILRQKLRDADERSLPSSWYKFLMAVQARENKILKWDETLSLFVQIMNSEGQSMISLEGSAESSLGVVLRYLHATGEIIWFADNPKLKEIIFHRPETLVEMLRAIFRHDFEEVVNFSEVLGSIANVTKRRFEMMKSEFVNSGLMTVELLDYILLNFQLSRDAKDMFIDLMLKFDLCYEVPQFPGAPATFGSSRIIRFPWFLTSELPSEFDTHWPKVTPPNIIELAFQLQFPQKWPPNFFEKMSSRLQSLVSERLDWHDGILAFRNQAKLLLQRSKVKDQFLVTLNTRGSDLQELWFMIKSCRSEMLVLLHEWPFIRFDPYLLCAHCIITGDDEPFLFPGEIMEVTCPRGMYQVNCPKAGGNLQIPACFIYPLDSEFQDDLRFHIKAVKDFLQNTYDTVDSAGLLSDLGLSGVASELGVEWGLVALNLGLKQVEIEQIQMDNPNQVLKQILKSLLTWRECGQGDTGNKIEELLSALRETGRSDLAEDLKLTYSIGSDSTEVPYRREDAVSE